MEPITPNIDELLAWLSINDEKSLTRVMAQLLYWYSLWEQHFIQGN